MKLGVMSDTHNNSDNAQWALETFRARGVERIIHCGDITTPEIVALFADWQVSFVFGNIDRDRAGLQQAVAALPNGSIEKMFVEQIAGKWIGAAHGDDYSIFIELTEHAGHDWVFHGHTHIRRDEMRGNTRIVNPGALGGKQDQTRSVAIVDLETGDVEFCAEVRLRRWHDAFADGTPQHFDLLDAKKGDQ